MAGHRFHVEVWQSEALRRIGLGESTKSVARALGRAPVTVNRLLLSTAGFVPKPRTRSPLRLSPGRARGDLAWP
jgi:hypothetical protein